MHYWNTLVTVLRNNEVQEKRIKEFESLFVKNAERKQLVSMETVTNTLKISKEVAEIIATLMGLVFKFYSDK